MSTSKYTLVAAAIFLVGTGCADDPIEEPAQSQREIIGGFKATGKSLNGIGTVGFKAPDGSYDYFCSASLIGPKLVLTAKHCAIFLGGPLNGMKLVNLERVYFGVGPDARAPIKTVEAIAADLSPLDLGGSLNLGSDVAIYHLAEPIDDVTLLPLADAAFTPADFGKRYMAIGYGSADVIQDLFGVGPRQRRAGYLTLRALSGQPGHAVWPTFEDMVEAFRAREGELPEGALAVLRQIYDARFLEGYEAWVGLDSGTPGAGGTSDAQACHGDSGGPLVGLGADKGIYGVVSGGYFSRQLTCDHGTFYATLGPKVREMIDHGRGYTDPCTGFTAQGTCDGTVATRCTDKFEGDRRLARVDCADLGQECRPGVDGVVGCFDEDEPATAPPPRPRPPTIAQVRAQMRAVSGGAAFVGQ
jgi:hypothetical protein